MKPDCLTFRIGSIGINLVGNPGWKYTSHERFAAFSSSEPPQANYEVKINFSPAKPPSRPVFDVDRRWSLYLENGRWQLWVRSLGEFPYLVGNFNPDFHTGILFTSESIIEPGKLIFPITFPMGELLMTNLLGTGYGILLHSCGVIDAESGIAFAGIGGAGKSTTARLWHGIDRVRVLNDDHTIIQKIDGAFRVYGTPWHGQGGFALAADAPLKKVFILKHGLSNQAVRLAPSRAAAALLVRTFAPLWDASAMAFTLQFLDELCQAVPCYELGFVPDQSAVEYVRCLSSN
jgi:hypothetical protein